MTEAEPEPVAGKPIQTLKSLRVTWVILAVYACSLALPTSPNDGTFVWPRTSGALTLWDCLRNPQELCLGWFAASPNFPLWIGIFLLSRRLWWAAALCGALGLAGVVMFPIATPWLTPDGGGLDLASGYYVWGATMLALVLAGLARRA